MNRYIMIHRLTGPAILLLLGVVALLHQAHLVGFQIFWPLLLILIGVIKLAERAAMANEPYPPQQPYPGGPQQYPGQQYPGQPYPGAVPQYPAQQAPAQPYSAETSIVPASHDFGQDPNGGKG